MKSRFQKFVGRVCRGLRKCAPVAVAGGLALVAASGSAFAQFDPGTAVVDPSDDLMTAFTGRFIPTLTTALTVAALMLAIYVGWARIRRYVK